MVWPYLWMPQSLLCYRYAMNSAISSGTDNLHSGGTVRRAVPQDACRIAEIKVAGWRSAYRGIAGDFELFSGLQTVSSASQIEREIEKGSHILVEETKHIVRGYIWFGPPSSAETGSCSEIYALYVQPEFTGAGAGTALIRAAEEASISAGQRKTFLWVLKENYRAINFYRRGGYSEDGLMRLLPDWKTSQIGLEKTLRL